MVRFSYWTENHWYRKEFFSGNLVPALWRFCLPSHLWLLVPLLFSCIPLLKSEELISSLWMRAFISLWGREPSWLYLIAKGINRDYDRLAILLVPYGCSKNAYHGTKVLRIGAKWPVCNYYEELFSVELRSCSGIRHSVTPSNPIILFNVLSCVSPNVPI